MARSPYGERTEVTLARSCPSTPGVLGTESSMSTAWGPWRESACGQLPRRACHHAGVDTEHRYESGRVIRRREVLHGRLWMDHPVQVIEDRGDILAVWLEPGSQFVFHEHPMGPHPWSGADAWGGTHVLQLYRSGDLYSVWKVFSGGAFTHWYINFEAAVVRRPNEFDTDDYGLDLVVSPDGCATWKDVEHLSAMLRSGRMSERQVIDVLTAAEGVVTLLERNQRWWADWDYWTPEEVTI